MADRTCPSAIGTVGKNWDSVNAVWLAIHHWLTTRRKISAPGCTNDCCKLKNAIDKFSLWAFWDFYPKILQLGISWRGKFEENRNSRCCKIARAFCAVGWAMVNIPDSIQSRMKEWFSIVSGTTSNHWIASDGLRFFDLRIMNDQEVIFKPRSTFEIAWTCNGTTTIIVESSEDIYFLSVASFLPEDIDVASRGEG